MQVIVIIAKFCSLHDNRKVHIKVISGLEDEDQSRSLRMRHCCCYQRLVPFIFDLGNFGGINLNFPYVSACF